MTFTPCLCSTPKFVPVINQPVHFILAAPVGEKIDQEKKLVKSTNHSYCRRLKKCHRYHWKQSNASTAINRQHHFDNETIIPKNHQQIFFCLPLKLFQISKRRHGPCYV